MKSFDTWVLILLGVMNVVIAATRAARQQDPWVWLSFFAILVAVIIITIASVRLQNGFAELSEHVDGKTSRRLRMNASSVALMANIAILSALSFVR